MITLTFQNVEELIFLNSELKRKLPQLNTMFHTYSLSQQSPELRSIGQRMFVEFVNSIKDEEIKIIEEHLNDKVTVQKVNLDVANHYKFSINDAQEKLNSMKILKEAFFAYREGDQLYISTWR